MLAPAGAHGQRRRRPLRRARRDHGRSTSPCRIVAARLRAGGTLTIVALGSSSTFGTGASQPENTYPSRLAALLAQRFPELKVRVINRGVGGEEAAGMARASIATCWPEQPDLVIWQVGTNGVLHDDRPAAIGRAVRAGRRADQATRRRRDADGPAICAGVLRTALSRDAAHARRRRL